MLQTHFVKQHLDAGATQQMLQHYIADGYPTSRRGSAVFLTLQIQPALNEIGLQSALAFGCLLNVHISSWKSWRLSGHPKIKTNINIKIQNLNKIKFHGAAKHNLQMSTNKGACLSQTGSLSG